MIYIISTKYFELLRIILTNFGNPGITYLKFGFENSLNLQYVHNLTNY